MSRVSRRQLAPLAAFTIVPRHVLGGQGRKPPGEKLNIAGVGVGGMGANYLRNCESENIVALCDVDQRVAAKTFARYPQARRYRDFRVMLEKEKGIDAVVIGTPDHTHAAIAMAAMKLGKHVYCAKPMTRTLHEARLLAKTARETGVATQMSVQSCASDEACATAEWVQAGAAGTVREVHVWSDRPVWPQGLARPRDTVATPPGLDWDLWLGPAPERPYHPVYHPFNWRGWCDFGAGALGDMGCHTLHVIFRALNLAAPTAVDASATFVMQPAPPKGADQAWMRARKASFPETFPMSSIVTWEFGGVRVHWYDGGLKPPRPAELEPPAALGKSGILFVGDRGTLLSGFSGSPRMIGKTFVPPPKTLPRSTGHYQEWIAAAKGGPPANCNFDFGALLTETALLGAMAARLGRRLLWDAENGRVTNDAEANALAAPPYRAGWSL